MDKAIDLNQPMGPNWTVDVLRNMRRALQSQLASSAPQNIKVVEKTSDEAMRPINKHPVGRRYRSIFGPNIDWRTDGFEGLIDGLRENRP